jgi:hypothetical protein
MKYFIICMLFITQNTLFSEALDCYLNDGRYIIEPSVYIEINDGYFSITYDWDDHYIPKVSGDYYLTKRDGINYINIKTNEESEYVFSVIALDDILFLVDLKTGETYHASQIVTKGQFPVLTPFYSYDASSFLQESYGGKSYKYKPMNLNKWDIMEPWVEGVDGPGIGQWLAFSYILESSSIYFINGFYDPYRPYLFEKNNRVKDFELIAYDEHDGKLEKKFNNNYTLEDTSELQKIQLPEGWTHFKIIIRSVYPGTAYDDTCIAGIFTDKRWGK